jgi:hypothetical protein
MNSNTRELVVVIAICIAALAAPVYYSAGFIFEGTKNAKQKEFIVDYWQPEEVTFIDPEVWDQKIDEHLYGSSAEFILYVNFDKYKEILDSEEHFLCFSSTSIVRYYCMQGKIMVHTRRDISIPRDVTITKHQYLGNGQIAIEVEQTTRNIIISILAGVFIGALTDFGILLALGIPGVILLLIYWGLENHIKAIWKKMKSILFE